MERNSMNLNASRAKSRQENIAPRDVALTQREEEILKLICKEHTSLQIGDRLGISVRTVETHRKNLLLKTGASSVVGLIKFAIQRGWLKGYKAS